MMDSLDMPTFTIGIHSFAESQQLLRDDDSLLRKIFTNILKHHHPKLASKVDVIYALSQAFCEENMAADFEAMEKRLYDLSPDERILVASCFSQLLNLHNLSEEVSNAQTEKAIRMGEVEQSTRSTNRSFKKLIAQGVDPATIYKCVCEQSVDLVFTAHPTQALRQSLLRKYAKIREHLDHLHTSRMSPYERIECLEAIRCQIQAAWRTDEIRRTKPTPQDEMRQGLAYFHETIFHSVPIFYRRIDTALKNIGQPTLPLECKIFQFGSWMGGDRDGNPFVTPEITRDVVVIARLSAVNLFFQQVEALLLDLSAWRCSPELKRLAEQVLAKQAPDAAVLAEERKKKNYADFWAVIPITEPFRVILSDMRDRLYHTRQVLHHCLVHPNLSITDVLENDPEAYYDEGELLEPLKLMYTSLVSTKDDSVANGRLLDLIRQVRTFGLSVVQLDIRQESTRHSDVLDMITTYLGMGSYREWDEAKRIQFLTTELAGKRPLMPPGLEMTAQATAEVRDVVNTFRILSELPHDSLGAYVISMARSASDVLAVVLLQRECGVKQPLRVVPLFETLEDLDNSATAMQNLLSNEWYSRHINGHQECMIGYSDSGKDAGRLAAAWGLYETQEKLVEVAEKHNVQLTLFHGRGGTVGRGGGPTHLAVLSQPPGTIKGRLRVTIQGEVIEQQFGEKELCFRTLDLYTSAVLEASLDPPTGPKQEWRDAMNEMSKVSCEAYRAVVRGDPAFIDYFQQVTPVSELGRMNIGSRPAKRKAAGSIDTLRAIPWIFAWTQIRFHLPVWLGVGEAFQHMMDAGKLPLLQEMYQSWPFFFVMLDMLEMVFAKGDPQVVQFYEHNLVDESLRPFGADLRKRFDNTKRVLLEVLGHKSLLDSSATTLLQQKIALRAPYVNPLNLLQVYALRAVRDMEKAGGATEQYEPQDPEVLSLLSRDPTAVKHPYKAAIEDVMIITMKGISAGMQNTG